jgi:hypothetical protein
MQWKEGRKGIKEGRKGGRLRKYIYTSISTAASNQVPIVTPFHPDEFSSPGATFSEGRRIDEKEKNKVRKR